MFSSPIIEILLFIGAAQGLLLAAVLVTHRSANRSANRILAALLGIFSLLIFFHSSGVMQGYPAEKSAHQHLMQSIFALFGPLLYFYSRASTESLFSFRRKDLLHAIPFILCLGVYAVLAVVPDPDAIVETLNFVLPVLFLIQIGGYYFQIFRRLGAYGKSVRSFYSSPGKIALHWLYFLLVGQAVIWLAGMMIEMAGGDSHAWNIVWLMLSVLMYAMGYFALRQPAVFAGIGEEDVRYARKKYERSTLTDSDAKRHASRLADIMEHNKPYLDSGLTLPDLARRLSLSTHHLSQVLNDTLGSSFFDYINSYRVEEAKRLLAEEEVRHYSIAAIGFEAGFNSLSAFNSVFKKMTGMTPSRFRQSSVD